MLELIDGIYTGTAAPAGSGGGGGASTVWAKNQLGSQYVVTEGDKVWLSPISSENEQIYKWDSNSSYSDWKAITLCSYSGVDTYLRLCAANSSSHQHCQLATFDIQSGIENISGNSTGSTDNVWRYYSSFHATPQLDEMRINKDAGSSLYTWAMYNQTKISCVATNYRYRVNGFAYKIILSGQGAGTYIVRMDESGNVGEEVGYVAKPGQYDIYPIYISSDGSSMIVDYRSSSNINYDYMYKYILNSNNQYVYDSAFTVKDNLHPYDIYANAGFRGFTSDGKYLIKTSAYNYLGGSNNLMIIEFDHINKSVSLYTGLGTNSNYNCNFYPYSDTLVAWDATNLIIRMWKYDSTNGFVEKTLDFGDVIFTNINSADGVTLNYDCSMMCVNCGNSGVYLFSLQAAEPNTYKAIPFNRTNFNSTSFTGILTGNSQDDNVEVKAVMD